MLSYQSACYQKYCFLGTKLVMGSDKYTGKKNEGWAGIQTSQIISLCSANFCLFKKFFLSLSSLLKAYEYDLFSIGHPCATCIDAPHTLVKNSCSNQSHKGSDIVLA